MNYVVLVAYLLYPCSLTSLTSASFSNGDCEIDDFRSLPYNYYY